jgi:peptidoglycan/LPS O-acetylase OafA/YrhL
MLSIPTYFILFSLLIFIYTLVDKKIYFTKNMIESRYPQLDGLRGVLTISVAMHHSIIMYFYFIHKGWVVPPSNFYTLLGQASVILFFMITGFLFGFKIFKDEFKIKSFFISRIRRIVPLHIFSVFLAFFVIFSIDSFTLNVGILELFQTVLKWLRYKTVVINNNDYSSVIETVYWTLLVEWKFYIVLPLLFFIRKKIFKINFLFIMFLILLYAITLDIKILMFLVGIISSYLVITNISFNKNILDIIGVSSILLVFIFIEDAYNFITVILLSLFFISILFGNIFKSILSNKIIMFLGQISYSIYLLHNIVVFVIFYLINQYYLPINKINNIEYWFIIFLIMNTTIILSSVTYKYIEHKFYHRKHRSI